jgi:hypothetical protein
MSIFNIATNSSKNIVARANKKETLTRDGKVSLLILKFPRARK